MKKSKLYKCPCCGREFPRTAKYFHVDSDNADGLSTDCADCMHGYRKYVHKANLARLERGETELQCQCCVELLPLDQFDADGRGVNHTCRKCKKNGTPRAILWPKKLVYPEPQQELFNEREYEKSFMLRDGVTARLLLHMDDGKLFNEKDALRLGQKVAVYALEVLNEDHNNYQS